MWTIEREGVALFLIKEGYHAEQVGDFIGKSKNAVIGMVNRLGITITELQKGVKPKPILRVKKQERIIMPVFEPNPCTIVYLTDDRCHWPLWGMKHDPSEPRYYCGAPVHGKVYCLNHWRQGTTKYIRQRRSRREPVKPFIIKKRPAKLPKSMVL